MMPLSLPSGPGLADMIAGQSLPATFSQSIRYHTASR